MGLTVSLLPAELACGGIPSGLAGVGPLSGTVGAGICANIDPAANKRDAEVRLRKV